MKRKVCFRMLVGIGMLVLGMMTGGFPGTVVKARAAGVEPTVSGLCIIDTGSGISAQCDYDSYAADSDYDIQLYLDQWDGNTRSTIKVAIIEKNGTGTGRTDAVMAESGIYSVAVVIRDNVTAGSTARFYETEKYRVVRKGDGYEISRYWENEMQGTNPVGAEGSGDVSDESQSEPQEKGCEHLFEEVQIRQADPNHDAVAAMQCSYCGELKDYLEIPNSAYACFQKESEQRILNADQEEIVICTTRWISFHHMVTDAMIKRPDVTVVVVYHYKGMDDTVVIPAGADRSALANEEGYCGFLYLKHVFSGTQ